jgi:hypothetical protein
MVTHGKHGFPNPEILHVVTIRRTIMQGQSPTTDIRLKAPGTIDLSMISA